MSLVEMGPCDQAGSAAPWEAGLGSVVSALASEKTQVRARGGGGKESEPAACFASEAERKREERRERY